MIKCNADYELHESRHREPGQNEQDWLRAEQDEQDWLRAQFTQQGSKDRNKATSVACAPTGGSAGVYPWTA